MVMQDWTVLVTSLSVISGVVLLASCFVAARFTYRRRPQGKASTDGTGPERPALPSVWLSAYMPRAQAGPNGTVQYMNGWFALDSTPRNAAWSSHKSRPPSYISTEDQEPVLAGTMREPHFSRAQRAARRARGLFRRVRTGQATEPATEKMGQKEDRRKKKARPSRTTDAMLLEEDAGSQQSPSTSTAR
ncbi:hypothetical protein JCM3774_000595 [Rhodotorula dairenensis]